MRMSNRFALASDLEKILQHADDIRTIMFKNVIPPDSAAHFRMAEKEVLLGLQSLLEAAIKRLDEKERQPPSREAQGKSVDIPIDE